MIAACPSNTLNNAVELYLIKKFNDRRKFFKEYLIIAQEVWKEIFLNTLFVTKSSYVDLKNDGDNNYVDVPPNCLRLLSLGVRGHCDKLKPLYNNQDLDIITKPVKKACSCTACNCESNGLCDSVTALTVTTKEVIIDDVVYTEYTWLSVCPNGDIMEYRKIPTTQYTFQRGSYDSSYDVSYEIGGSEGEVVNYTLVRKLCALKVKPCGCPEQTPENETLFFNTCGCFLNPLSRLGKRCNNFWRGCSEWAGEYKMSPCGTKVIIKNLQHFEHNHQLLMSFQMNGVEIDGEVMIPNYATMCLHTGIEYQKILFNDKYKPVEKQQSYYKFEDEKDKIIVFLNPISIEVMESLPAVATW